MRKKTQKLPLSDVLTGLMYTIIFIGTICYLMSCNTAHNTINVSEHTYETDDTHFYNGEILLPDYVHSDTLVITDAKFINWAMEYYDAASDGDIFDILHSGAKKYIQPSYYIVTCSNDTIPGR